jgi:hypothetical protein
MPPCSSLMPLRSVFNLLVSLGGIGEIATPSFALQRLPSPIGEPTLPLATPAAAPSSQPVSPQRALPPIRPKVACPTQVEPLMAALLRDLPSYINRLSHQRQGSLGLRYAIAASPANLQPLSLPQLSSPTADAPSPSTVPSASQRSTTADGLHQVFFTVLERQYATQTKQDWQQHHWLFLAHSPQTGWQLTMLYSRSQPYPNPPPVATRQPVTPMQETSQAVSGRAIRQWLRDCAAGAIQAPPAASSAPATP